MQETKLFGITNCDSIKRARAWLESAQIKYYFHDFRKQGIDAATLERWLVHVDWQLLLNRRGTTWRKLDPERKQRTNGGNVCALLSELPSIIKRPVLEHSRQITVGFSGTSYHQIFNPNCT